MTLRKISFFERTTRRLFALASSFALAAAVVGSAGCGEGDDDNAARGPGAGGATEAGEGPAAGQGAGAGPAAYPGCERGVIEADLNAGAPGGAPSIVTPTAPQWQGPGVDPTTGALAPGNYVFSSTYLTLRPEGRRRFSELMGPISTDLRARSGLLAFTLATSEGCLTARTLSVWESEEAMYAFVGSEAHSAAVSAVGEVSRGESVVTHWSGTEANATWVDGADALRRDEGPFY